MERSELFACEFCGEEGFHDLNGHVCEEANTTTDNEQSFYNFADNERALYPHHDIARSAWDNRTAHYEALLAEKDAFIAEMLVKAAAKHRPAYDEQQRRIAGFETEIRRLRGIIDNGLGPEDMQDDH